MLKKFKTNNIFSHLRYNNSKNLQASKGAIIKNGKRFLMRIYVINPFMTIKTLVLLRATGRGPVMNFGITIKLKKNIS